MNASHGFRPGLLTSGDIKKPLATLLYQSSLTGGKDDKEGQCSRYHQRVPSQPLPTPSTWIGLRVALGHSRESQATGKKRNRSEALELLLVFQGTCGQLKACPQNL